MELQVAKHEDAPEAVEDIWGSAAQMAMVGSFVILLGICLYLCRPILLPVAAAIVIGTTLAPLVKAAARHRIPPWLTAGILGLALLAAAPTVLGRRLTLNPLAVLLALAFWAWIWGPMGAFLAVPLTIVTLVTLHHMFPADESRLPG